MRSAHELVNGHFQKSTYASFKKKCNKKWKLQFGKGSKRLICLGEGKKKGEKDFKSVFHNQLNFFWLWRRVCVPAVKEQVTKVRFDVCAAPRAKWLDTLPPGVWGEIKKHKPMRPEWVLMERWLYSRIKARENGLPNKPWWWERRLRCEGQLFLRWSEEKSLIPDSWSGLQWKN